MYDLYPLNSVHDQNFIDYLNGEETNSKGAQDYSKWNMMMMIRIIVLKLLEIDMRILLEIYEKKNICIKLSGASENKRRNMNWKFVQRIWRRKGFQSRFTVKFPIYWNEKIFIETKWKKKSSFEFVWN